MEETKKTLVINLLGGPCTGKSAMASAIFSELKFDGFNAELVPEYAKGMTWQSSLKVLQNQIYVFGKQHQYLTRPKDQVRVIITDSPLLLSVVYDQENNVELRNLVLKEFRSMNNFNIFLTRSHAYQQAGRTQSLEEAVQVDQKILDTLEECRVDHIRLASGRESVKKIVEEIKNKLN